MVQRPLNAMTDLDAKCRYSGNEWSSLPFLNFGIHTHPIVLHDVGYRQLIERTEVKGFPEYTRFSSPISNTADDNSVRPVHLQSIRSPGGDSYQPPNNS